MARRLRLGILMCVVGLIASACGDDAATVQATETTTTTTAPQATSTSTSEAPSTTAAPADGPVGLAGSEWCVIDTAPDDALNVRTGPGTAFEIMGTLPFNALEVITTGETGSDSNGVWYGIDVEGETGWVASWFLRQAPCPLVVQTIVSEGTFTNTEGPTPGATVDYRRQVPALSGGTADVVQAIGEWLVRFDEGNGQRTIFYLQQESSPGATFTFDTALESFVTADTVSFRFVEYIYMTDWPNPITLVDELTFSLSDGRRLSVSDLGSTFTDEVYRQARDELAALVGDDWATSVVDSAMVSGTGFVLTEDGVELTFDEEDGLPGVVAPYTVSISFDSLPPIG